MKKKDLEIFLESLEGFKTPKIFLEQYVTPPPLVAEIVTFAKISGDLELVFDLGCGTGIIAIASALLGAFSIGVEVDRDAIEVAKRNAKKSGVDVDFVLCDVEIVKVKKKGTVIMNPPFGIQKRHADRKFLLKAFEIANVIYTVHSAGSEKFVEKISTEHGFKVTHVWKYMIPLKKTYDFHEKPYKYIPVEVFRIERCRNGSFPR